ncbi:adenosylcobinamide-GDP ribazoletransferase [Jannaschia sp. Os4]|uniref:adenosylcobinamide-GDP ribazoletransferase n=1 Tax=Jannaschia sp. Os4 TaxID=2807617 RepID=UPI00193A6B98|nr:adenosylcobinamide-GDP ribazoletransferase [Jannaschia sp. Os4]MBM2574749.1 adenosylcobinamide-GDP ribazoletransferase [Jannaschia sp. Os4]
MRADLISALMLMTRLPVRGTPSPAADGAWAWPVAGALVGLLGALAGTGAAALGLPTAFAALLAVAATIAATGALHEDGLADCADGLWGGRTPARRLDIMRDSRLGSYGALALVVGVGAKWSLATAALDQGTLLWALPAAAAASRAPMAWAMRALPAARTDGLSRHVGIPGAREVWLGAGLAALLLAPSGLSGLLAALAVVLTALACVSLARAKLGGQTGDVLGGTQQMCEIAALAALTLA